MKYTTYPTYKDSGIAWLGEIPEHWELMRVKQQFEVTRGRVIPNTDLIESGLYPVYSSQTKNNGLLGKINSYDFEGEYISWTTDGVYAGTTFVRKGKFNATNICGLLKSRTNENIDFLGYLFSHITPPNKRPDTNGAKIMSNEMKNISFVLPPKQEQTTIANFLDYKTEKINRFIKKKKQLIKLLNEQKAAIINQAVTGKINCQLSESGYSGLKDEQDCKKSRKSKNPQNPDADRKMKDSGIEWLGEIPEHWEVRKLKYVAKINNGKDCDKKEVGKYPVYGSGGIFGWFDEFLYDKPSVLLGRKGTIDKPQFVTKPFWTVDTAFYTQIKEDVALPIYFYYLCCNIHFGYYSSKTALPSMTQTDLYEVKFAIPSLQEQQQIVQYIETETQKINKTISTIEKEITLVEEYKTALIAEAVTGKIDVRGVELGVMN